MEGKISCWKIHNHNGVLRLETNQMQLTCDSDGLRCEVLKRKNPRLFNKRGLGHQGSREGQMTMFTSRPGT
jgi:hypothetical protein